MSKGKPMRRLIALTAGLVLSLSLASAWTDEPPTIFPIGRYTLPTNAFHDLYDHVESIEPGGIKYDDEFRHPFLPLGSLVVDCQKTHRIGVTLAIDKPPRKRGQITGTYVRRPTVWSKQIKVKFHWSHSETDELDRTHYVTPSPYHSGNVISDGMTLTKKSRIDGVWSIYVTYHDAVVYRTSFELVRCPAANAS